MFLYSHNKNPEKDQKHLDNFTTTYCSFHIFSAFSSARGVLIRTCFPLLRLYIHTQVLSTQSFVEHAPRTQEDLTTKSSGFPEDEYTWKEGGNQRRRGEEAA